MKVALVFYAVLLVVGIFLQTYINRKLIDQVESLEFQSTLLHGRNEPPKWGGDPDSMPVYLHHAWGQWALDQATTRALLSDDVIHIDDESFTIGGLELYADDRIYADSNGFLKLRRSSPPAQR